MSTMSSPQSADDFCLVGSEDLFALPIRSRPGHSSSKHNISEQNVEDEYDVVSRPSSVRSFGSPSPSPETPYHNGSEPPAAARPAHQSQQRPCTCGQRMPPFAPCVRCTGPTSKIALPPIHIPPPTRCTLSQFSDRHIRNTDPSRFALFSTPPSNPSSSSIEPNEHSQSLPGTAVLDFIEPQSPKPVSSADTTDCHDHTSLDRAIMDNLMAQAIESHSRTECQNDTSTKAQLAMQMLVRLLKLPSDHRVSRELVRLQPALFHPLYREAALRKAVFEKVFTKVERAVLYSIVQSHKCNFKQACVFADCLTQDFKWLSDTDTSDLRRADRLASEIQMSCVNNGRIVALPVRTPPDWQYTAHSAMRARATALSQGTVQERAAANINILYSRDLSANYRFPPGTAGFTSIDAMVVVEALNKALPDLTALKRLHDSRLLPLEFNISGAGLKREASTEDLSCKGFNSPPWKRISLPDRNRLPSVSSSYFVDIERQTGELAEEGRSRRFMPYSDVQRPGPELETTEPRSNVPKSRAQGHSTPSQATMISDFEGDISSLGLHPKTLECLRVGRYPSNRSLAEVRKYDYSIRVQVSHTKACANDYDQQLLLLEEENRRRMAAARAERENEYSALQSTEEQLKLIKEQRRKTQSTRSEKTSCTGRLESELETQPTEHCLKQYEPQLKILEEHSKRRVALARLQEAKAKQAQSELREHLEGLEPTNITTNMERQDYSKKLMMFERETVRLRELERHQSPDKTIERQLEALEQENARRLHAMRQYIAASHPPIRMPIPVVEQKDAIANGDTEMQTEIPYAADEGRPAARMGTRPREQSRQAIRPENSEEAVVLSRRLSEFVAQSPARRQRILARAAEMKRVSLAHYQHWLMLTEGHDARLREERKKTGREKSEADEAACAEKEAFEPEMRVW